MTDKEIIDGYIRGDRPAFALVDGWIKLIVQSRLHKRGVEPDDIHSEAHEEVLIALRNGKFKFESALKTFIDRIVYYTICDYLDRNKRFELLDEEREIEDNNPNPENLYIEEERFHTLDKIVNLMNEECRKLWKLIFFEELPYKVIGEKLGISEGTVKIRHFRCKDDARDIGKRFL